MDMLPATASLLGNDIQPSALRFALIESFLVPAPRVPQEPRDPLNLEDFRAMLAT